MSRSFTFPVYEARTESGEVVGVPTTDCQSAMITAASYERFAGEPCHVAWAGVQRPNAHVGRRPTLAEATDEV